MKDARNKTLELILSLVDDFTRSGDVRFKDLAEDLTKAWTKHFGDLNDPDPKVPKAGELFKKDKE